MMDPHHSEQLQFWHTGAQRNAMTLIEMITIIALVSIIILVAIPVILYQREQSRQKQCIRNLAQIVMANQQYELVERTFPMGFFWTVLPNNRATEGSMATSHGPLVALLPHLENDTLFASINFDQNIHSSSNTTVAATDISTFQCPSDTLIAVPANVPNETLTGSEIKSGTHQMARSSYAGMAGPWLVNTWKIDNLGQGERSTFRDIRKSQKGLFQSCVAYSSKEIQDGLSHTIAFGEHAMGPIPSELQRDAFWWVSGQHGDTLMTSMFPINPSKKGLPAAISIISASSSHAKLAHFAFLDGSVKPIRDTITTLGDNRPPVELASRGIGHIQGWIRPEVEVEIIGPDPFWDTVFHLRASSQLGIYQALTTRDGGETTPGY